jgi:hypothetical protein
MTKKHFNALAEILREAHANAKTTAELSTVENITREIARFCKTQNGNFDTARFIVAAHTEK